MTIFERLRERNGISEQDMQKPSYMQRISELEAENADLKAQIAEQADALVELAEIITEGE